MEQSAWWDKVICENSIKDYFVFLGLLLGAVLVAKLVSVWLRKKVIANAEETENRLDDLIAGVGVRPISLIIFLAGASAALSGLKLPLWLGKILPSIFVVAWAVVGAVFLTRFLNGLLFHYLQRYVEKGEDQLFQQIIRIFRSVVGVAVWIVSGLFIIDNLGFDVSSLLAGVGLGGAALALASKDALSNVFGAFTILVNGPFRVGEAIKYQGHAGTVEKVGLRETLLRTWDGHLVTIPNSLAPTSVIENISRRPSFRVMFRLGVTYETPEEKLNQLPALVQQAVRTECGTTEDIRVHFLGFADSAIEFQVIYFIEDSSRILDAQHSVNRKIKEFFDKEGIDFAYPTLTVKPDGPLLQTAN